MMGSKRRVAGIIDLLQEEGNAAETVAKIHMPIGLNIGALTVPEIAISIVAELIEERRKRNAATFTQPIADLYRYRSAGDRNAW